MNILIFGINGNLGRHLIKFLLSQKKKYIICSLYNKKDILFRLPNTDKIIEKIIEFKPDIIINLVAYADVDGCQKNLRRAYLSNVLSNSSISRSINSSLVRLKPHLVHISTDHVYNRNSFDKENETEIVNNYAFTKFLGEEAILGTSNTILRTNYIGKSAITEKDSLSDWIINSLSTNKQIMGFTDIKFNPVHVNTLCKVIELCCIKKINGKYNVGANGFMTKYDYALLLAEKMSLNTNLIKQGISDKESATRPKDMRMNIRKFEEKFDYQLPNIYDEVIANIGDYN
mgnify:CR=1 FL=1